MAKTVQYQGPYSPAVYNAANKIANKQSPAGVTRAQYDTALKLVGGNKVLGASKSVPTSGTPNIQSNSQVPTGSPSNSDNGSGEQDAINAQIDAMYNAGMGQLSEYGSSIQKNAEADQQLINEDYTKGMKQVDEEGNILNQEQFNTEDKFAKTIKSALDQALRAFNAMNQQRTARFGAGSSAGQAVGELAQQEYFRNQGKVNETSLEGSLQFDTERKKITSYITGKKDQLDTFKKKAIQDIKTNLSERLNEIAMKKGELENNKTAAKMQVLQDAINRARDVQDADRAFRQNLASFAVQQMQSASGRTFTPAETVQLFNEALSAVSTSGLTAGTTGQGVAQTIASFNPNTNRKDELQSAVTPTALNNSKISTVNAIPSAFQSAFDATA